MAEFEKRMNDQSKYMTVIPRKPAKKKKAKTKPKK